MTPEKVKDSPAKDSPVKIADTPARVSDFQASASQAEANLAPGLSMQHITELREAMIQTILVIFLNKENQHLLLNEHIIEVAISCIKNSDQLSDEALLKLASLVSIIF